MRRICYSMIILICGISVVCSPIVAQNSTPEASPSASPEAFQEDRAIAFYPEESGVGSFISVEMRPGESTEIPVVLGNAGNVEQTLRTYSIPAESGINGGFVLPEYGTVNDAQTGWLDYPESEYTFAPGEGVIVNVGITVPHDTAPGEYVTALATEQADAFEVEGSDLVTQRVRWSVPILIVVPGEEQPAFEVGGAELEWLDGSLYGNIEIANTGNVILSPVGEVRLLDSAGSVVGVGQVALQPVYTSTETFFVAGWQSPPESESYSLEVSLTAEDGTVSVNSRIDGLVASGGENQGADGQPLLFSQAELVPLTQGEPPSMLHFDGVITNIREPIENARVSIVTYQDGEEVDRYPIMQAVTIQTGETPVEARYSLPGGFTEGTYTFEVTIELGSGSTQSVLVTQPIEFEVTVGD